LRVLDVADAPCTAFGDLLLPERFRSRRSDHVAAQYAAGVTRSLCHCGVELRCDATALRVAGDPNPRDLKPERVCDVVRRDHADTPAGVLRHEHHIVTVRTSVRAYDFERTAHWGLSARHGHSP
jgi:hypothetical protein